MKSRITHLTISTILFLFVSVNIYGQSGKDVKSDTTEKFLQRASADFAVPDAPAFKILQSDPSTIIRPTSPRAVAVTIANLLKGGYIPDNYALEISPGLLFSNSLSKYQKNPLLYRTRFSFASKTSEKMNKSISTGIRMTLLDDADPRLDEDLINNIRKYSKQLFDVDKSAKEKVEKEYNIDEFDKKYDSLFIAYRDKIRNELQLNIEGKISSIKEKAKKNNWNKAIIEIGIATSALSGDSTAKNLSVDSHQIWLMAAFPLGQKGQLLSGINAGIQKDQKSEMNMVVGSFGIRSYWGVNEQKLYLEGNIKAASELFPSYSLNIGYEHNITNGIWADIAIGLIKKDGSKFVSHSEINFRFATPEAN